MSNRSRAKPFLFRGVCVSSHHLHSTDVLLLLHIDVCKIQPDIADLRRGLSDLGKDIPCLSEITLMCQHSTYVTQKKDNYDEREKLKRYDGTRLIKKQIKHLCHWQHTDFWNHSSKLVCRSPKLDPGVAFPGKKKGANK